MDLCHRPSRPGWQCQDCDLPWPCEAQRRSLHAETGGNRLYLSIYVGLHLADAIADGLAAGDDLHDRFFGWITDSARRSAPATT
ncbi:hypothetical protein Acsp02_29890 [Actinoplanes sp. NBRC 103695]|nr:hypothetical protein Acsp02_29890 [Actinoplanes sp. NBRC 103695]